MKAQEESNNIQERKVNLNNEGKIIIMKENIRNKEYRFRANKEESNLIEERFKATEFQDISKYLRHMATVGGVLLEVDNKMIKDIRNAVQTASNNINQIARRMNVTGRIYMDDVEQLKAESSAMREELQKITQMLEMYADIEKSSRNYYWLEN